MPFEGDGHYYEFGRTRPTRGQPALFLDRDGVIIKDRHYLKDSAEVCLIPGASAAVRRFREAGYAIIIITNQSGIGRGLLDWRDFLAVQLRLRTLWAEEDVDWDMVLACGHHPTEGVGPLALDSDWRKPRPGMIRFAANSLALDLPRSVLVGDRISDLEAGFSAGVERLVHVRTGYRGEARAELDLCAFSHMTVRLPSLADLSPA
jgi:D-glycero-D-manno-heptose 1,7-bisphosphate phosphatase